MVELNNRPESVGRLAHLTAEHQKDLESSGLTLEQIAATGHFSADQTQAKRLVGCKIRLLTVTLIKSIVCKQTISALIYRRDRVDLPNLLIGSQLGQLIQIVHLQAISGGQFQ